MWSLVLKGGKECVLIKVLQKNRPNRRYIMYYKELANTIMEAEESQDLHLASWRLMRVDGVVPIKSLKAWESRS